MKQASDELKQFLASTQNAVKANLYTFTLSGGTVLRFTDADVMIKAGGLNFLPFAGIRDGGVKQAVGVTVDTLRVTFLADSRHAIGGVPFIRFVRKNGLDGAIFKAERAYAIDWATMFELGPVGTVVRFWGRYSEVLDGGRTEVTVQAASWFELLNTNAPADVWQSSCLNTLFGPRCGVDRNGFDAAGIVAAGTSSDTSFPSNLATAAGYYDQGTVVFGSGPNEGQRRSIRSQDVNGRITLSLPLPFPPQPGDSFVAWPGCDLSKGAGGCLKFNNLGRFRGQPFIPVPETAL